jgi:hypothetical protein
MIVDNLGGYLVSGFLRAFTAFGCFSMHSATPVLKISLGPALSGQLPHVS